MFFHQPYKLAQQDLYLLINNMALNWENQKQKKRTD